MDSSLNDLNPKFISGIFKTLMSWIWLSVKILLNQIWLHIGSYITYIQQLCIEPNIGDLKNSRYRFIHIRQLFVYITGQHWYRPWRGLFWAFGSVAHLPPWAGPSLSKTAPLSGPYPTHNLWSHMISELN
jgi:hypothetical protein